jgi:hypothetical protein
MWAKSSWARPARLARPCASQRLSLPPPGRAKSWPPALLRRSLLDRDNNQQAILTEAASITVTGERHAQLIASAKLSPSEAEGWPLNPLAAAKYNAGVSGDDRQSILVMAVRDGVQAGPQFVAAAGLSGPEAEGLTLNEIASYKFKRDTGDY